jgi:hypothetical protein
MSSRSVRTLVSVASLSLLGACATTRTTTTEVSGTPRLEPTPANVTPAPAPAPAPAAAYDPTGRWDLVLDLNGQSLEVVLELVKTPSGAWGGSLSSQMGNTAVERATLEGNRMTVNFTGPDGSAGVFNLTFSDKTVEGTWSAAGMGSRLSGTRR